MAKAGNGKSVLARALGLGCALGLGAWLLPEGAQAAGVEDTVGGTVALGRAANYARVNDFMATQQNPANLAISVRDAGLELRVPLFNACFDRVQNPTSDDVDGNGMPGIQYRQDDAGNSVESFAKVCNKGSIMPTPNLGVAIPVMDSPSAGKLGIGFGIFAPSGVSNLKFGDDTLYTRYGAGEKLEHTTSGKEAPNRYLLIDREVLAAWATLGVGYAPTDMVRFGASFGWGFTDVKYKNVAAVTQGFEEPFEVVNHVSVKDIFIPRAILSAALTPIDAVDVFATFTWTDDIKADGNVDVQANGIKNAPRKNCRDAQPGPHCRVDDVTLEVPFQRFEVAAGGRYAARRVGRQGKALDPIADEIWDIEFNAQWSQTSHVKEYVLTLYDAATDMNPPRIQFLSDPTATAADLPARAALPHYWKNTYTVRLGGDYNVLPNKLAVRAGASYETSGIRTRYMSIDYWPVQKIGVHVGATYRVGPVDLHIAYAHLFNETVTVKPGEGQINQVTAVYAPNILAVNEGKFTSSQDIISLQGNWRF